MRSSLIFLLVLLLASCSRTPSVTDTPSGSSADSHSDSNVVATVNGAVILRQTLEARLKRSGRVENPAQALEELIRTEAIYQKALAARFDQQPEIQARIRSLIVGHYRERQASLTNYPPVGEEELQAAFAAQREQFRVPAKARGAAIFIEGPRSLTPEKRAERRRQAEEVLAEARAAEDDHAFAGIAARHSEDRATRYRGGDTGWIGAGTTEGDPALAEALLKLAAPGEFAPLVETARGFYIARLIEKREAQVQPLDQVREALRYQLSRRRVQEAERDFYETVKDGLDIRINRAVLGAVAPRVTDEDVPPAGPTTAQVQVH